MNGYNKGENSTNELNKEGSQVEGKPLGINKKDHSGKESIIETILNLLFGSADKEKRPYDLCVLPDGTQVYIFKNAADAAQFSASLKENGINHHQYGSVKEVESVYNCGNIDQYKVDKGTYKTNSEHKVEERKPSHVEALNNQRNNTSHGYGR